MGLESKCFLARLREETRAEHERVEGIVPVMRDDLDVETYRRVLARFYGYHAPLEIRFDVLGANLPRELHWPIRRKCTALRSDLLALGFDEAGLNRLPHCPTLPDLSNSARALGCLYVLEGASLGGQVICRHLRRLEPAIAQNRRFFEGYGERTGTMWRAFRALLVQNISTPAEERAATEAARETFQTFAGWMSEDTMLNEC